MLTALEQQAAEAMRERGLGIGQDEFLIWSEEHRGWWKPNHCGYTGLLANAGRYAADEAERIVRNANFNGDFREIAIPIPAGLDELIEAQERFVRRNGGRAN